MDNQDGKREILDRFLGSAELNHPFSRRQFLKLSGVSIIGISALSPLFVRGATKPLIIMDQAKGVVIADPTKCVGCRPEK